jgi:adenosine deaminase
MAKERENIKMAVISGASHALKFRDRYPRASNEEAIRHVTEKMKDILKKIEEDEED